MSDAHRASHGKVLALLDLGACSTARDVCWGEHVCAPTVMGLPRGWRGCWQPRGGAGGAEGLLAFPQTF